MKYIYLDYAAATPLDPEVKKAMEPFLRSSYGNPSSLHRLGQEARKALESSRATIASLLGVMPRTLLFTSSGTESNNLAILGLARAHKHKGSHLVISSIEHPSVDEAARQLEHEGFSVTRVGVNGAGRVEVKDVVGALRRDTILVSVMYANNEVGSIQPIAEIAKQLRRLKIQQKTPYPYFHTDASQASEYCDLNIPSLGVNLLSLNGSKVYGPKGVGLLYAEDGMSLQPVLHGGGQERGLRAGTEHVAAIVGLSTALGRAQRVRVREAKRVSVLRDYAIKSITKAVPKARLNGGIVDRLPNNVNISFRGVDGEAMVVYFDARGIAISTGSACSMLEREPSRTLRAMGCSEEEIMGSVRLTLGRATTRNDIQYFLKVLPVVLQRLL